VYHANTGACNGCDIEVINTLTPYYDAERFGIKLVDRRDMRMSSGNRAVTRPMVDSLKRVYEATPAPKLVFAVGSCPTDGGIWYDTIMSSAGWTKSSRELLHSRMPPRPEAIVYG